MTNGNDPINSIPDLNEHPSSWYGLTKREYFAANNNSITWDDAVQNATVRYGENVTILQVAQFLAEMKRIAADALINALNETK